MASRTRDPALLATVRRMRDEGYTQSEIALEIGYSREGVTSIVRTIKMQDAIPQEVKDRLANHGVSDANIGDVRSAWLKGKNRDSDGKSESVFMSWPLDSQVDRVEDMLKAVLAEIRKAAPSYTPLIPLMQGDNLLVIDPADLHVGKLCHKSEVNDPYNSQIAVERMERGADALLQKALVHGVHSIVLVIGNDILHADRWNSQTTAGTPQDTDGLWHEWFQIALRAYTRLIERLARVAPVHLIFCPSNHDWQSGYYLAQTLGARFHNHPDVHTGPDDRYLSPRHRKYFLFDRGLLGFTHGDGAKETDLPNIMQLEARDVWSQTKYSYWYTHHLHHKRRIKVGLTRELVEQDKTGVSIICPTSYTEGEATEIEVVRSPSAPDGWHHRNGYLNPQAVECYLHSPGGQQFARFTEFF